MADNPLSITGCIHCRPDRVCEYHRAANNPPTDNFWYGYLQHGQPGGSMRTEQVRVMHDYADRYRAWYDGNWRRVYVQVGRTYIRYHKRTITILIAGTPV